MMNWSVSKVYRLSSWPVPTSRRTPCGDRKGPMHMRVWQVKCAWRIGLHPPSQPDGQMPESVDLADEFAVDQLKTLMGHCRRITRGMSQGWNDPMAKQWMSVTHRMGKTVHHCRDGLAIARHSGTCKPG